MAKNRLFRLSIGDKFTWNNIEYVVTAQSARMSEVQGGGRLWAWPSSSIVNVHDTQLKK